MNTEELKRRLAAHAAWLDDPATGERLVIRNSDLREADLRGADLRGADLSGSDLREADLSYADLIRADLRGSDLRGADLRGANLRRADLHDAIGILDAEYDRRGYRFVGVQHEAATMVSAGCRWRPLPAAEQHWAERHSRDPELRDECRAIVARIRAEAGRLIWRI